MQKAGAFLILLKILFSLKITNLNYYTENLNVLPDLADFLKAITKNPNAYVLTYCKYGKGGEFVSLSSFKSRF